MVVAASLPSHGFDAIPPKPPPGSAASGLVRKAVRAAVPNPRLAGDLNQTPGACWRAVGGLNPLSRRGKRSPAGQPVRADQLPVGWLAVGIGRWTFGRVERWSL